MNMYPDEQVVVIDGVEVSYPGLLEGKFSSGDFADPSKKPSFIPAETINLILDNLGAFLVAAGCTPDNSSIGQLVNALAAAATAKKIVQRDANGRAQFSDPSAAADAATKNYVDAHTALTTAHGAVSAATASKMVVRDPNGRAQFASPSASADAATKAYVDAAVIPPVGYVYIQGAGDASPATLWPSATWSDVSSEEAGRYRRIKGTYSPPNGGSMGLSTVGATQDHAGQGHRHNSPCTHSGANTSGGTYLGTYGGPYNDITVTDPLADGTHGTPQIDYENRPATVIVAKWRRIA